MKYCTKCAMPDTRPRLTFDENGICSACQWSEEKNISIDWDKREAELIELCNTIRGKNKFDCLVPASGGKDSTYVAHKMKHTHNLNVLTVTITPPLETDLIQENMKSFLNKGYDNIKITPNPLIMKTINRIGFIEQGRPLLGWTSCLNTAMLQIATSMNVPLIMFGEEGESEYGGSNRLRYKPFYTIDDATELYTYGNDPAQYSKYFPANELVMWTFPTQEILQKHPVNIGHWSYFENWDPYNNFVFARDNYNMKPRRTRSIGTYTNYGQLDTPLYDLHAYMMYLKFGFGRCTQDACIDIRGGRISRKEAVKLIAKYDGESIDKYIPDYCDYFEMDIKEFEQIIDKHANKTLLKKQNGKWIPLK
ncbi:MAG: N-acetyl sugar amidotransferase [Anaerovoracaceae bacterium]|nr:N-acetyl sugar amidotransferase [Clostridiales bacterium]